MVGASKNKVWGEGSTGLARLLRALCRRLVRREEYYVYEFAHADARQGRVPDLEHMSEAFVASNQEAEDLSVRREDPRSWVTHARRALDAGAVLFCIHAGDRLAHAAWLAASEPAWRAIDSVGFKVPFEAGVAWTGRVRTAPQFRERGLFEYGCVQRFAYLTRLGVHRSRTSIGYSNAPSHAMAHKLNGKIVGKGHVFHLLWWHWWLESRLASEDSRYVARLIDGKGRLRPSSSTAKASGPRGIDNLSKLIRERGFAALAVEAFRRYVVDVRRFYLYEHHHSRAVEVPIERPVGPFDEFFVSDNATADQVASDREDFRLLRKHARQALDAGAVAFCVYQGHELVHLSWIATSHKARRALDHLGYCVSFEERQAWTGAAFTCVCSRGRGLLNYACRRRFEYLRACGIETSRAAVEVGNLPSHLATMRFRPRIYAIGRQVKLLGFRWWSEQLCD